MEELEADWKTDGWALKDVEMLVARFPDRAKALGDPFAKCRAMTEDGG